jgi:hypothetical protein
MNKRLLVVSIVISFLAFIVIFGYIAKPNLAADLPFIQRFINIYYPAADAISITLAVITLQIGGGRFRSGLYILSLGLLFMGVADLFYTYRNAVGVYWNGDVSDLLFTFHAYFLSIGLFEIINNLQQEEVKVEK